MECMLAASTSGSLIASQIPLLQAQPELYYIHPDGYYALTWLEAETTGSLEASTTGSLIASTSGSLQAETTFNLQAEYCMRFVPAS